MYLEHLVPKFITVFSSPKCFFKRLLHRDLVSFGLMANLNFLAKKGVFDGVDGVVDVGANIGQFAYMIHTALPHLAIYSYEPDPACFNRLQDTFSEHKIKGKTFAKALADSKGSINLNIYESSANNSILSRHNERVLSVQKVECSTLDLQYDELSSLKSIFLKIDVQGAELAVLSGAVELLKRCKFVQLEVSLVNAYNGNAHIADIMAVMRSAGFGCWEILDVLRKKKSNGLGILEMDLLFAKIGATGES